MAYMPQAPQARAMSLHIGLNAVDPAHYAGWDGALSSCEFDAKDMYRVAQSRGMVPTLLLTEDATREAVLDAIDVASRKLLPGDLFFLSYSGHGGQVPDVTGEEKDKLDETWCLHDGQLLDDELYLQLARFAGGVRILVLSDSCHSGTVVRAAPPPPGLRTRSMPRDVSQRTYAQHQMFYDGLQRSLMEASGGTIVPDPDEALSHVDLATSGRLAAIVDHFRAAVILVAACQDNQSALDGAQNGAFTERLLAVWNDGAFRGNYASFHARIVAGMPPSQTPNLFTLGRAAMFLRETPFTVSTLGAARAVEMQPVAG